MRNKLGKYKETDSMSELICENYPILLVMSRFGIALGFGDKTIGEVCYMNEVDTPTFLTIVNMLLDDDYNVEPEKAKFSIESLIGYQQNSHNYFLEFRLPQIRCKLQEILNHKEDNLSVVIMRYFDEYVAEVRKHMQYEEQVVFPYVKALLNNSTTGKYNIGIFSKQHNQVEARLTEFKHIIIKYFPSNSTNEVNSVLFDIFSCEKDLASHNAIEDKLFIPAIERLEQSPNNNQR